MPCISKEHGAAISTRKDTRNETFTNIDGTESTVKMMHHTKAHAVYFDEKYDVAELDYIGPSYCMDILLPHEGESLESCLKDFKVDAIAQEMRTREVQLSLPKWTMNYDIELNNILSEMGITDAFSPLDADFSGISDHGLFVGLVKQITSLTVSEEGTEAAAVTIATMLDSAAPDPKPIPFTVNRPFRIHHPRSSEWYDSVHGTSGEDVRYIVL